MKNLKDILYKVALKEVVGTTNLNIESLCFNSKMAVKNSLFVAVKGTKVDGHNYIKSAIDLGAVAIVCEEIPNEIVENVSYLKVENSSKALGIVAANFYENPSTKIKLVGITGTNGKSTCATLLYNLVEQLGYKCGLISTIEYKIHKKTIVSINTTPDALTLNKMLFEMVEEGCEYCFMEVSSHAIHQNRIEGLVFEGGAFTNLTHDHLDYHSSFKEYLNIKKLLFDGLSTNAFAITNIDDKNGNVMLQNCDAQKYTYSIKSIADFKVRVIENTFSGLQLKINGIEVNVLLTGIFNAYNLLLVYAVASILNFKEEEVLQALSALKTAEGRFDFVVNPSSGIIGIVDYAHTPDAVENVLENINNIRNGNSQLITIIGCGGDRDRAKRPLMANVACKLSNKVILTSDNPRSESISEIIKDMQEGISPSQQQKVIVIENRSEAIKTAALFAKRNDVIAVLGKGHEKYQEINGEKFPFDDKQILNQILNQEH